MKLSILLSTIDNGINEVKNVLLEYREDVSYLISHQYTSKEFKFVPSELERSDVTISHIQGYGVTKSRNNAIKLSEGEIGLFSDDDVTYTNQYFDDIISVFDNNSELDLALFKIKTPEGYPEYKKYPNELLEIQKLPFAVGTIEIAFRVKSVQSKEVFFDERFGAGQPLLIGADESIFVLDCIKKGLKVWFVPKYVVNHPFESSIKILDKYDKRRVSVVGASDARINGISSIPRAFLHTLRLMPDLVRNKKKPLSYLIERLSASIYIFRTNKY